MVILLACVWISETTRFHHPDELLMDGMGCDKSELERFCCTDVFLRIYGSFDGLVELCHLELLTSTEKLQKEMALFHSQTH